MTFRTPIAAAELKTWRKSLSLNQTAAAKVIGVSQPTYSEYETGRKTPRTVKAIEIQEKTGGKVSVAAWGEFAPDSGGEAA